VWQRPSFILRHTLFHSICNAAKGGLQTVAMVLRVGILCSVKPFCAYAQVECAFKCMDHPIVACKHCYFPGEQLQSPFPRSLWPRADVDRRTRFHSLNEQLPRLPFLATSPSGWCPASSPLRVGQAQALYAPAGKRPWKPCLFCILGLSGKATLRADIHALVWLQPTWRVWLSIMWYVSTTPLSAQHRDRSRSVATIDHNCH